MNKKYVIGGVAFLGFIGLLVAANKKKPLVVIPASNVPPRTLPISEPSIVILDNQPLIFNPVSVAPENAIVPRTNVAGYGA